MTPSLNDHSNDIDCVNYDWKTVNLLRNSESPSKSYEIIITDSPKWIQPEKSVDGYI